MLDAITRTLSILAMAAAMFAVVPASSVQAASTITCNSGTAPQISGPDAPGDHTIYGYFTCNVNPASHGVTSMSQSLGVEWLGGSSTYPTCANGGAFQTNYYQQSAAWTGVSNLSCSGSGYRPYEYLYLNGNFSFGSVPGCGRTSSTTVRCFWEGPIFYISRPA